MMMRWGMGRGEVGCMEESCSEIVGAIGWGISGINKFIKLRMRE